MDALLDADGDRLGLTEGLADELGDLEADGEGEMLADGDADALGDGDRDGLTLGLTLADGDCDGLADRDTLADGDGDGLTDGDTDELGEGDALDRISMKNHPPIVSPRNGISTIDSVPRMSKFVASAWLR